MIGCSCFQRKFNCMQCVAGAGQVRYLRASLQRVGIAATTLILTLAEVFMRGSRCAESRHATAASAYAAARFSGFLVLGLHNPQARPTVPTQHSKPLPIPDVERFACRSGQLDRLRHCSTSSLESCGAVSGPIASSCPSQFASPSHAVGAGRHDATGRSAASVPVATTSGPSRPASTSCNNGSTSEGDQGFTRIPVSNQVRSVAVAGTSVRTCCDCALP